MGVSLYQTTRIISGVSFITAHVAYASTNKTKIVWTETELFLLFFTRGGRASCLRACLDAMTELESCVKLEVAVLGSPSLTVLVVSVDVKQLLTNDEGANSVGGQLRGDKECPFSGRVWRKVPEGDARSVCSWLCCCCFRFRFFIHQVSHSSTFSSLSTCYWFMQTALTHSLAMLLFVWYTISFYSIAHHP